MCGIIGIASNKSVSSAIINSLRKLEYRGYDSAGIATLSDGILNEAKSEGRVDILEKNLAVKKSKTKIKDNVFIGSNSSLVAPITLEKNSIIGAGSVITKKVKKNSLALTRSSQTEVKNYKRKIK